MAVLANCPDSKAGYCVGWTGDSSGLVPLNTANYGDPILQGDFGWEASMTSALKNGRRDFGAWGDAVLRCHTTTLTTGAIGEFQASRDGTSPGPVPDGACD